MGISQQPRHDTERVKIFRYRQVKDQILPRMLQLLGSAAPKMKVQAAGLGWSCVPSFCITICHYMMSRYVEKKAMFCEKLAEKLFLWNCQER